MSSPQHAEIARRAYEIWEREGCAHGRELAHWLAAERELIEAPEPSAPEVPAAGEIAPARRRRAAPRATKP